MSKEEAHSSWNGFNFQGKISILVALEKINKINESEYSEWSLEIEGAEDFALKYQGEYSSFHQVKNYSSSEFSTFEDALIKLGLKDKDVNKYFHTRLGLPDDWKSKLQKITKKQPLLVDAKQARQEYLKFYEFASNIKKKDIRENRSVCAKLLKKEVRDRKMNKENELTDQVIEAVLAKHNKKFSNYKDIDLINLSEYTYETGENKLNTAEVIIQIKTQIEKYWGKETSKKKKQSIDSYYTKLFIEIDKLISQRAENKSDKKEIYFEEIVKILEIPSFGDEESKLLEYIAKIEYVFNDFCNEICDFESSCTNYNKCSIDEIIRGISRLKLSDVEKLLRTLDFSNIDDLYARHQEITNKDRIKEVLCKTISQVRKKFILSEYKIVCNGINENKHVMASTIKKGSSVKE
ncbi:MAG: ABC-three component system protein, partial [Eubacteriales bacterium]